MNEKKILERVKAKLRKENKDRVKYLGKEYDLVKMGNIWSGVMLDAIKEGIRLGYNEGKKDRIKSAEDLIGELI